MTPPCPGLTPRRRIVLDLAFHGYGRSTFIAGRNQLLAIADPASRFDPVAGAHVAREHLGTALAKLTAVHAKFDLIVSEIPNGAQTPYVGAFTPPRPPQATSGRRLAVAGPISAPKPPEVGVGTLDLALATWRATVALMSGYGEAMLTMPLLVWTKIYLSKEPGLHHVWWAAQVEPHRVNIYLMRSFNNPLPNPAVYGCEPTENNRPFTTHPLWSYTLGQGDTFARLFGKK